MTAEAPNQTEPAALDQYDQEFDWSRATVIALVVLCLAALLDTIDVSVLNVAMPAIKDSLHFPEGRLAWLVNAYVVPFGGFLLLGGRIADVYGHRRVLIGGTAFFGLASLGSALAHDSTTLIATRAAQGLAAAFVIPTTLAMLAAIFPSGPSRNRAFAVWGATSAISGTLGLIFGGLIVSSASWRWIFVINIPVAALIIVAALRVLPAEASGVSREARRFDGIGAVAVTVGTSVFAYAVVQTDRHPWSSPRTIVLLSVAVIAIGYFVVHEIRLADDPLIPLSMWRNRSLAGASVLSVLQSSAILAMFYATTLYMQQVLNYSPLRTGLAYIPLGLSIIVAAGLGPVLVPKLGVRLTVIAGSGISAAGLLLFTRITAHGGLLGSIVLPEVLFGLGAGLVFIPTSLAALSGVGNDRNAVASAMLNVSRQLGGATGLAVIAALVSDRTQSALGAGNEIRSALTSGFRLGFWVCAALILATIAVAAALLSDEGRGVPVDMAALQPADA